MGSIIHRGTRTKEAAKKDLAQVEARVAQGKIGIEEEVVVPWPTSSARRSIRRPRSACSPRAPSATT